MIRLDGFLDIETADWDTYVIGAAKWADGSRLTTTCREELYLELLERGGEIWTWNGGKFDSIDFLDWALQVGLPCTVTLAGSRVTCVRTGKLRLRDAVALIPLTLARAAELCGREKGRTGLRCICNRRVRREIGKPEGCGGYCAIRLDMSPADYRQVAGYVEKDVDDGYAILDWAIAWATAHGLELSGTIGGSSWRTLASQLAIRPAEWASYSLYHLAALGDYGGRVQVFRPGADRGWSYDINSAYPAALARTRIPVGKPRLRSPRQATRDYRAGKEGIYAAHVAIPDMHVPPLPIRLPSGRIAYPTGPCAGHWTGIELRYAESLGVVITRMGTSVTWVRSERRLKPYVDRLWRLRARAGKTTALGEWLKFWLNAPTGKFSQSPVSFRAHLHPPLARIRPCRLEGRCSAGCLGGPCPPCRRWRALDPGLRVWAEPVWRLADCAYVHWGAYLRAATRIEWHRQAVADGCGGKSLLYGDTDNVKAMQKRTRRIGAKLGQWGYEGRLASGRDAFGRFVPGWAAIAPKAYSTRFYDPEKKRWRIKVKCKGLSGITPDGFARFQRGETVHDRRGVVSFVAAARSSQIGNLFRRKDISRTDHSDGVHYGDRVLRGKLTYPQSYAKVLEYDTSARGTRGGLRQGA